MSHSRIRWTSEEDAILVQAVKANLHNRAQAFREAETRLPLRTVSACQFRWYDVLGNPKHEKYVGCLFTLVGQATKLDNRSCYKEHYSVAPNKVKRGIWSRIKKLLGL
jgi:hypothetical protein